MIVIMIVESVIIMIILIFHIVNHVKIQINFYIMENVSLLVLMDIILITQIKYVALYKNVQIVQKRV